MARISWADLLEPVVCELPLAACASRGVPHPLSISRCERACGGSYSRTVQQRRRALRLLSMLRCSSCSFSGAAFCIASVRHVSPLTQTQSEHHMSGTPTRSLQLAPIIWNGQLLAPRNALRNQIKLCGIAPHRTRLRLVAIPCNGSVLPLGNSSLGIPIGSVGNPLINNHRTHLPLQGISFRGRQSQIRIKTLIQSSASDV